MISCQEDLINEYPDLDILSVKPGSVSTKTTGSPAVGLLTIKVEDYVLATLNQLGSVNHSYGHWRHSLLANLLLSMPEFIKVNMFKKRHESRNKP